MISCSPEKCKLTVLVICFKWYPLSTILNSEILCAPNNVPPAQWTSATDINDIGSNIMRLPFYRKHTQWSGHRDTPTPNSYCEYLSHKLENPSSCRVCNKHSHFESENKRKRHTDYIYYIKVCPPFLSKSTTWLPNLRGNSFKTL